MPILLSTVIGSVSFWGSNIAFGKLQDLVPSRPIQSPFSTSSTGRCWPRSSPAASSSGSITTIASQALYIAVLIGAAVLGNLFVLPIGGADMPVVISLLNAFTGLPRPRPRVSRSTTSS